MMKFKSLKAIALLLGLAAGMMLPASASAQGVFGDMLDNYYSEKESSSNGGALLRGAGNDYDGNFMHQTFGNNPEGNFTHQTFGNGVPVGGGLFILLSAGIGYAAMKRKKQDKKNQRNKGNQIN